MLTTKTASGRAVTLMRGHVNITTNCVQACVYYRSMAVTMNKELQAADATASATLNYFRCYSLENGNSENANDLPMSGHDIKCSTGNRLPFSIFLLKMFSMWSMFERIFEIQLAIHHKKHKKHKHNIKKRNSMSLFWMQWVAQLVQLKERYLCWYGHSSRFSI